MQGDIQKSCRKLLIQICDAEDIVILKGVVSKDHVHAYRISTSQDINTIVKKLKERTSRKIQGVSYFAEVLDNCFGCWSTGNITDKMVNEYLEHHRKSGNDNDSFILE